MEGAQSVFKAGLEPVDHVRFHPLPRDRMAPQENLRVGSRVRLLAVDTVPIDGDRAVRCGCDGRGRGVGVEHPGGAARDHEIDVSLSPHPGEVLLGRDPAVHHDDPALGNLQGREHRLQRVRLDHVTGKDLGAAQKAAAVEDRTERQERRVRAPFLRMPVLRLGRTRRLTLERGVREIIQRDDRRQVEQGLDRAEHMVFECLFMFEQMIGRTIQSHVTQGAEVDPQQLTRGAGRAQPGVGRPFRSRLRHPADDIGQCTALLPFVETECTQLIGKIQQLERLQRRMLDADRPGIAVLERLDIDPLPVRGLRSVLLALQQAFDDPPRLRLDLGGKRHEIERRLVCHQLVDTLAQQRPVALINGKVTPKIQQRLLADLIALPSARNQTVGKIGLPAGCGACSDLANKQAPSLAQGGAWCKRQTSLYVPTLKNHAPVNI